MKHANGRTLDVNENGDYILYPNEIIYGFPDRYYEDLDDDERNILITFPMDDGYWYDMFHDEMLPNKPDWLVDMVAEGYFRKPENMSYEQVIDEFSKIGYVHVKLVDE